MNIERELKVRDAIKYCIENFDSQTATNRIVEFWKDELKLQEQQCNIADVVGQSEQLVAFCRWYNQAIPSYEATEEEIVETYLRESN
jgi:hypothetical protein